MISMVSTIAQIEPKTHSSGLLYLDLTYFRVSTEQISRYRRNSCPFKRMESRVKQSQFRTESYWRYFDVDLQQN